MPRITALPPLSTDLSPDFEVPIHNTDSGDTEKITLSELTGYPVLGWIAAAETWTYSSWSSTTRIGVITVPSDATTKYQAGNRVKITQSTGGTKYGIIHEVTSTTLTVHFPNGTTLNNEAISSPWFTPVDSPIGFDKDAELWELAATLGSNQATTSTTWTNTSMPNLALGKGSWDIFAQGSHGANRGSTTFADGEITLSTANNTESDSTMTRYTRIQGASGTLANENSFVMRKNVKLAAQTTFYLNHESSAGTITHTTYGGASIKALSRYL